MDRIVGIIDQRFLYAFNHKTNIFETKIEPERKVGMVSDENLTPEQAKLKFKNDLGVKVSKVLFHKMDEPEVKEWALSQLVTEKFQSLSFQEKHDFMRKYNI